MSDVATVPLSALRPVNSPFRQGLGRAGSGVGASSAQGQPQGDYARGYADGLAAAAAQADDGNHAAEMIRRAIHDLRAEPAEELGLYIAEAVTRIVRQIVGETQISADEITRRAHAAAALIADNDAATAIRLHPEDAALVGASVDGIAVLPEPGLRRGDVLVDCAAGTIEDGNAQRLAALDAALGLGGAQ